MYDIIIQYLMYRKVFCMAAAKKKNSKNVKSKKKTNTVPKNYMGTYVIVSLLVALFSGIFMYTGGEGGIINDAVKFALCGLFGRVGYLFPVIPLGLAVYLFRSKDIKRFWVKAAFSSALLINIGALINLSNEYSVSDAFFNGANNYIGGGVCGAAVSVFLEWLVRRAASYIILSITLVLLAGAITGIPIFKTVGGYIRSLAADAQGKYKKRKKPPKQEYVIYPDYETSDTAAVEAANSFANDSAAGKRKKSKKVKEDTDKQQEDIQSNEPVFSDGIEDVFGPANESGNDKNKEKTVKQSEPEKSTDAAKKEKESRTEPQKEEKEKAPAITAEEKEQYSKEFNTAIEKPVVKYVFPPLSLLDSKKSTAADHRDEMRKTAERLISVLDNFGVKAKLLQVTQGPTVTRYEIQPDTGIKLSKIVGLADDLALNLAVSTVLVAPVPGKVAVGVEIPNKKVSSVSIREMIESSEFKNAKSKLTVALGKDIGGNVVVGDVSKWPHVLIAGATGSGKSVCINTIVTSILYKASPEDVKLIMVDPKVVELGVYNGIPHLLVPVVTDPKKAAGALNWAVTEMMRRYELFKDTGVRKLESYNKLMESTGGEKVPQLVIIIDELADLMMVAAKEVEDYICRLAQLARAAGIHLIIATQRPSVDVITGLIKANIPSRVAFAVSSQVDSRTIIDRGGAEKLLGMGDMLYYPTGARAATRVQGAFVSDDEIEKIIGFIKDSVGEMHYSEDLAEHIERCSTGENGVTPDVEEDGDALLPDAIELAVELGKISTSMVQRRLGVGYSRAGRIIDQMEARGIISGANGSKPRDVLISHADMLTGTNADYDTEPDMEAEEE